MSLLFFTFYNEGGHLNMAKTKLHEILEGKSLDEIITWHKRRMSSEVGKAYNLGLVKAYTDFGYTPSQIAEKLNMPESRARRLVYENELIAKKER